MKKDKNIPYHYNSLTELHRMLGLPKPLHPLISLFDNTSKKIDYSNITDLRTSAFYKISYKSNLTGQIKYGQHHYDFDEGGLFFVSPNQITSNSDNNGDHSGYTLLIHPDFLLSYPLANKIKQYGFLSYSVDEALHLSDKERDTVISIFKNIDEELKSRIDDFSQDVMISLIETLLNCSNRFYKRQFITRKQVNNDLLQKMEKILEKAFEDENLAIKGIPTVQDLSNSLHLSPSYLSDMLRSLTGQNAQQHIQNKIIEKSKEKLSTSDLSISEIAYELGFEYSQSFSRLFKAKTGQSPVEFKARFN